MPKARRSYSPTAINYRAKFIGNILSRVGGALDVAREFAEQAWAKHTATYTVYSQLYHNYVKPVLVSRGVHSTLYGLYRSFALHVYKNVESPDDPKLQSIISDWSARGLDPSILDEIASKVFEFKVGKKYQPEETKP